LNAGRDLMNDFATNDEHCDQEYRGERKIESDLNQS
jgi:hypothetical protein